MAPKRANPIEVPPAASSDEEEEVTSSGEEDDSEEGSSSEGEEEEETQTPLVQKNPPPKTPETATPSAANEDSEESGSESESESDTPKSIVRPIATKPVMGKAASSSKRPPESSQQEDKEAKRPKKKAIEEEGSVKKPAGGGGGEDAKKNLFQRLFSEEDEIALLKGMLDYSAAKKGADPNADMNAFYDFVKKSIHTDVTKAQVIDKIRRLKKKFENNAGKGKGGEDPNFSKAHEFNAFKLSKKIWGKEGISGKVESSAAKSNGKAKGNNKTIIALKAAESISSPNKKVVVDGAVTPIPMEVDNKKGSNSSGSLFDKRFGVGSLEEEILKRGCDMVDAEKKAALDARWRNFQIRELELFVERNEMVTDLAKSMLESYKSGDK